MSSNTIYLVTGANRGIGRAITAALLARPNTTVVAGVRNPSDPTSASLRELSPAGAGSKLTVAQLSAPADYDGLAAALAPQGITSLDTVIANAGSSSGFKSVAATTPEDAVYDFEANVVPAIRLFHATWPLLQKGRHRRFVVVSSTLGSIGQLDKESFPGAAYGASKAAVNFWAKKAAVEFKKDGLVVGIVHPGWVKTYVGQALADSLGMSAPPMTPEQSAAKVVALADGYSAENSGKFYNFDGSELPW